MTVVFHTGAMQIRRAPRIKATELRRLLWEKFGHRCAMVKTEKRGTTRVIHVIIPSAPMTPRYNKIAAFTAAWDEVSDHQDKQVINLRASR